MLRTPLLTSFCILSWLALCSVGAPAAAQPPELILVNGRFETVDARQPRAEALAIRGDRILALGAQAEIARLAGPATQTLDLGGRFAMPGFIESHAHLVGLGAFLEELDLTQARSWDEIVDLARAAAAKTPAGGWVVGRGWQQSKWDWPPEPNLDGYPLHGALSAATPEHPVLLVHRSGHMCLANARAMRLAGLTRDTQPPPGGEILHDRQGEPTGVLRETATSLVFQAHRRSREALSPAALDAEFRRRVELAQRRCLALGVTSFQDAGVDAADVPRLVALAEAGSLDLRLWLMLRSGARELAAQAPALAKIRRAAGDRVTVGGIKRMRDGALGAHGALLLEPYSDLPGKSGLAVSSLEEIERAGQIALEHDLQLCVHAIGDRANREMLDLFARMFAAHPGRRDLRWRIEHAQHLHPDDIPRFARLGVIASMQANHAASDGPFVESRLGRERAQQGAYAWQSLLKAGAVIANGTDAPVEDVDPLKCFAAAVTRKMADGRVFFPAQSLTRAQALRAYTLDAAYAAREEELKGSLTAGKLADVVVLTHDLLAVPDADLGAVRVWKTIVGGRVVHPRP